MFNDTIGIDDILSKLQPYNYICIKTDAKHFQKDIGKNFTVGKDLDIIVSKNDFSTIQNILKELIIAKFTNYDIKYIEALNNYKIRVERFNCLIIQFDISVKFFDLDNSIIKDSIIKRIKENQYFIPTVDYELFYRLEEIKQNPHKQHHKSYVVLNAKFLNDNHYKNYKSIIESALND